MLPLCFKRDTGSAFRLPARRILPVESPQLHIEFGMLQREIAASLEGRAALIDEAHRSVLAEAVQRLATALAATAPAAQPDSEANPHA